MMCAAFLRNPASLVGIRMLRSICGPLGVGNTRRLTISMVATMICANKGEANLGLVGGACACRQRCTQESKCTYWTYENGQKPRRCMLYSWINKYYWWRGRKYYSENYDRCKPYCSYGMPPSTWGYSDNYKGNRFGELVPFIFMSSFTHALEAVELTTCQVTPPTPSPPVQYDACDPNAESTVEWRDPHAGQHLYTTECMASSTFIGIVGRSAWCTWLPCSFRPVGTACDCLRACERDNTCKVWTYETGPQRPPTCMLYNFAVGREAKCKPYCGYQNAPSTWGYSSKYTGPKYGRCRTD